MREPEREHAVESRLHRNPLVRVGAGLRHSRFHLNKLPTHSRPPLSHLAVSDALRHGRVPRPQEIGAERNHVSRLREIESRKLLFSKAERIGASQDVVTEKFERDRLGSAEAARKFRDQIASQPALGPRQKRQRFLVVRHRQRIELRDELRQRFVPSQFLELPVETCAGPFERMSEAIGMIRNLNRSLSSHAKLALVDGIGGIAVEFLREAHLRYAKLVFANHLGFSFHDTHAQPAAG